MRIAGSALVVLAVLLTGPGTPRAAATDWADAALAFHLKSTSTKNHCTTNAPNFDCSTFVVEGDLDVGYHVYVVVAMRSPDTGIAGVEFGIQYDSRSGSGVDVFGWQTCADNEFPDPGWPTSGRSNRITWDLPDDCQRTRYGSSGVQAVAGWFYVTAYSRDSFSTTPPDEPHSWGEAFRVVDCEGVLRDVRFSCSWGGSGVLLFSSGREEQGCTPCRDGCWLCSPVDPTTWGRIKAAYPPPRGPDG